MQFINNLLFAGLFHPVIKGKTTFQKTFFLEKT